MTLGAFASGACHHRREPKAHASPTESKRTRRIGRTREQVRSGHTPRTVAAQNPPPSHHVRMRDGHRAHLARIAAARSRTGSPTLSASVGMARDDRERHQPGGGRACGSVRSRCSSSSSRGKRDGARPDRGHHVAPRGETEHGFIMVEPRSFWHDGSGRTDRVCGARVADPPRPGLRSGGPRSHGAQIVVRCRRAPGSPRRRWNRVEVGRIRGLALCTGFAKERSAMHSVARLYDRTAPLLCSGK